MQWVPRSPFQSLEGCIFLGRIIDKARRHVSGAPIGEYMYGDSDYMDSRVFKLLATNAAEVNELVRTEPDDEKVARALVVRSGKTPEEIRAFSRKMRLIYTPVFIMFDADEGRNNGRIPQLLCGFYNRVMYPHFAKKFLEDQARNAGG
ncbi:MAG: DUF5069 domain-containing protein [Candidatus Eremiobacteraeota bacterium]|nr:DUF5069 domain-containing protein [Candidatus Eremiobacteraeota bacterium]